MKARGKAFKYGNNIDTDIIIAARHLNTSDPEELKKYCMQEVDPDFINTVEAGDIIVGGKNFGCGSSREHAPVAIKASGISCVIAENFARIFYRNSFNIGLPIVECKEASEKIQEKDIVEIDFDTGLIKNITKDEIYIGESYPEFIQGIIKSEGLVSYLKSEDKERV